MYAYKQMLVCSYSETLKSELIIIAIVWTVASAVLAEMKIGSE